MIISLSTDGRVNMARFADCLAELPPLPVAQRPLERVACMNHLRPSCDGCVFETSRWCPTHERIAKQSQTQELL